MNNWQESTLKYYYQGVLFGEYPAKIMNSLGPVIKQCTSMLDVCSGPGAFSLWGLAEGMQVTATDILPDSLAALTEKAQLYPKSKLTTIAADFRILAPPQADLVIAACCFSEDMAEPAMVAKIADAASKIAVFVMHDGLKNSEFATASLKKDKDFRPRNWEENSVEEYITALAEARQYELHHLQLSCDFGCFYDTEDSELIDFISRKSGVYDIDLLKRHLADIATAKDGRLWLPNLIPYKIYWLLKGDTSSTAVKNNLF